MYSVASSEDGVEVVDSSSVLSLVDSVVDSVDSELDSVVDSVVDSLLSSADGCKGRT